MTLLAIVPGHGLAVAFMTLETIGKESVFVVAVDTLLLAVGIGHFIHHDLDLRMAGHTGRADILHFGKRLDQRGMGSMAPIAILQGEMGILFRRVAADASRRSAILLRRMLGVATEAADILLMPLAIRCQLSNDIVMTGGAQIGGNSGEVTDRHRVVRRMAALAIGFDHGLRMGGMTAGTLRRVAVGHVASIASQVGVRITDIRFDRYHAFVTA
jgi:hypothetical protein